MADRALETAARPQEISARDDAVMLGALGIFAYAASMVTHEALGHGVFCLAHGGRIVMLTPWGMACNPHPAGIEAAGPLVQFLSGLLSWAVLRAFPRANANLRCALWLTMTYDLLVSSGYVVLSGIADFGDAAVLIKNLAPHVAWRVALVVLGGAVYYASMWAAASELKRFAGSDNGNARLNRLVWIPYLAAGVLACCAGALNKPEPGYLALILAAASAFGAFGLVRLPDLQRNIKSGADLPASYIQWSFAWGLAAALTIILFITLLGPGIFSEKI